MRVILCSSYFCMICAIAKKLKLVKTFTGLEPSYK